VAERESRRALRFEVSRGPAADQGRVRASLDALVSAQQRRAALLADEQRELAAFLTPLQRAQYLGLQERAFRAAQRLRGRRAGFDSADSDPGIAPYGLRRPRPAY
jgi:Spy/CpxP family protein refolding chaperone